MIHTDYLELYAQPAKAVNRERIDDRFGSGMEPREHALADSLDELELAGQGVAVRFSHIAATEPHPDVGYAELTKPLEFLAVLQVRGPDGHLEARS